MEINVEKVHPPLVSKPKDLTAPPRATKRKIPGCRVKGEMLWRACSQGHVFSETNYVFNQDYSPHLQNKLVKVHEVMKLLEKDIGALF
jgi:hypothetical protein